MGGLPDIVEASVEMSREALLHEASIIRQHRELVDLGASGKLIIEYRRGVLARITASELTLWKDGEQWLCLVPALAYDRAKLREE